MRCKIGYWCTGMAVQLDEEAYEWLKTDGLRLTAQVLVDRRVLLCATHGKGMRMQKICQTPQAHSPKDMFARSEIAPPFLEFMAGPSFELPRFEVHDLSVDYDYAMDGLLTEPLGPDYSLPWPRLMHRVYRMSAEELRHQCYLRIKSHMLTGGHGMFDEVNVPKDVVHLMAGGYKLAFDKARKEVDYSNG